MFHSMNQSRHDLKVGLHQAQQSYEMRLQELDSHHSHQLHQLRQRAQTALEEAEQRYQADLSDLRKRLEAEQSSRSAAQYHIESLQRNLRHLRDELEEKREDVAELPLLRETCRHQRDELRELQKLKQQLPELQRQLEESQAAQKKLQEKLRKAQKEKAEKVLEEPVEKAYEVAAAPYTGWSEMPSQMAWSEPAPSYGYGQAQAYGDSGFNAEIPQPLSHGRSALPEIQTSMAWDGGEGSMEGQQAYGDGYAAEMPPYGEVHWAQQGVEGETGFSPAWSETAPQVKEKKKKKHRDKKKKQEEEHAMDDFASVSTTPTAVAVPAGTAGGDGNIDAQVKMLKDMGFADENRVRVVLEAVGNDVEKAVPVLLSEH